MGPIPGAPFCCEPPPLHLGAIKSRQDLQALQALEEAAQVREVIGRS